MAITEYPAIGTRVEGSWTHPADPEQWERVTGTVVNIKDALTAEEPEGAGYSPEDADFFIEQGVFDDRVAVKIETVEYGFIPEELKGQLSNTYANFAFDDLTVLD